MSENLIQRLAVALTRRLGGVLPINLRRNDRLCLQPAPKNLIPKLKPQHDSVASQTTTRLEPLQSIEPPKPLDSRKRKNLILDVVGSCNLRCPSCAVGNSGAGANPTGLMAKELLDKILKKANHEYQVNGVYLYNWAEALLHPYLPELVKVVKGHHLRCALSSNLNIMRDPENLLLAKPDELRISLSGYTQDVYAQTHSKGDIERVKKNMRLLSECKKAVGNSATRIYVYFHKYKHNLHEVTPMRVFAESLGFGWLESWAYYTPIEKVVALAEGTLPKDEQEFIDKQYALPIREALRVSTQFKDEPCDLLANQIVLDLKANVILCCGVYNFEKNTLGNYLEMTAQEIEEAKKGHSTCETCSKHGIHRFANYVGHPQLREIYDRLVADNLKHSPAEVIDFKSNRFSLPIASS